MGFVGEVIRAAEEQTDTQSLMEFKEGLSTKNATELLVPCFEKIYHAFCILQNFEYEKLLTESEKRFKASNDFQKLNDDSK